VIVVQVRQQDRRDITRAERGGLGHRHGPPQEAHPIPQKRIGQQPDAVQVQEHG
jgi:hypothetical protein